MYELVVTDADIGRKIIYHSRHNDVKEEGVITSFNDNYVFVRFGSDLNSKACHRLDLEYAVD